MGKGDLTNGDCMLPVKTDKDIIRYLREALRIQEHNTHSMADKYCKVYKMYKAYRISKRKWNSCLLGTGATSSRWPAR